MSMITLKARLARCWKSWTIWFNGIAGAVVAALPLAQDSIPQLQAYLPPNLYQYLMGAVVLGNIVLRFKTNSALEHK